MALNHSVVAHVLKEPGNTGGDSGLVVILDLGRVLGLPNLDGVPLVGLAVVVEADLDDTEVTAHAKHGVKSKADRRLVGKVLLVDGAQEVDGLDKTRDEGDGSHAARGVLVVEGGEEHDLTTDGDGGLGAHGNAHVHVLDGGGGRVKGEVSKFLTRSSARRWCAGIHTLSELLTLAYSRSGETHKVY